MFTSRFLNLLHGRLALTNRDVWALALARRWNRKRIPYFTTKPLQILKYGPKKQTKLKKIEGGEGRWRVMETGKEEK